MNSPVQSKLDRLADLTTITNFGDMERRFAGGSAAVREYLLYLFSLTLLNSQLTLPSSREVTPPLDPEEEAEEVRMREAEARKDLLEDGCPPCYPDNLELPLRPPFPAECEAMIYYWTPSASPSDVPLCAQREDWRKFRLLQKRNRRRYKVFSDYEVEVRDRRRRHGLDGDVRLTAELERQGPLERWIEFQDYQLQRLEELEKKCDSLKEKLSKAEASKACNVEKASAADDTANDDGEGLKENVGKANGHPAYAFQSRFPLNLDQVGMISWGLSNADRSLLRHRDLLHWVEHKKQEMASQALCTTTPGEGVDHSDATRSALSRGLRTMTGRRGGGGRGSGSHPTVLGKKEKESPILHRQLQPLGVAKRQSRVAPGETVLRSGRVSRPPQRLGPVIHHVEEQEGCAEH
ncbi:hypothetical protein QQS21_011276 [Conoideocrella luteorostrata]|uniref:Uncharacterized protein n=1 Tax=Conoideocrella luteorostrata TaxID=1105319 RepID=A0AAJ0FTH0_9HYPO|nr:hypothetical protein QQS21_011276 [Conoideocrella luteorostrata]